jgi:hypothetical protein|tara:strand:- start:318 stop:860 length:543 start_codon:yes stop_codon:yes gene_type:complete
MVRAFLFLAALLIASPAVAADWIAVMSYDGDNRITKYQPLGSLAAADAHVAKFIGIYPDAFSAEDPGGSAGEWLVDPIAHTLANSPLPTPVINVLSFDDFESRFTTEEWNEATDFVYAINVETGVPLRRTLLQNHSRAIARNSVDLLHDKTTAFMDALVVGEVITQARSDQILDAAQSSP